MTANQEVPERKRRSREEIKWLVSEFEKSGLRPAKFCRSRGLALSILQRSVVLAPHLCLTVLHALPFEVKPDNRLVAVELARRDLDKNQYYNSF